MENLKVKTGERVLPAEVSTEYDFVIYLRHLSAYEAARREIAPGAVTLDLGCGEGYGASALAGVASRVQGLDVNPEAIAHAAAKYGCDTCAFLPYDGKVIPFPDATFDAIVSFQVIEHIRDDRKYVAEAFRVLKKPGVFLVSTPNRSYRLPPGMKPWNRFHVREYLAEDLAATLRTSFSDVRVRGIRATDAIQQMEMTRVRQNLKIARLDPLNLRSLLPESVIPAMIRLLRKAIYRDPGDRPSENYADKYSVNDFHLIDDRLDQSLDLFAVCRK